ncbi:hypothetical protein AB205_0101520 [Aquarana catesbeiana]|uniref:Uncharacterized protein n=1 Tax=Aquarana catesbeiana TaxID=8400 RepID=A0A2G9RLZ9_AQUCT|nr:hypothetical protein AB205_0101520 [Aquarana catesbeiana]
MYSAWNSAKTDNCTTLPSNVLYPVSGLKYLCSKYTFCLILIEEKRLRRSENTRNPQPHKEGELSTPQTKDVEEGQVDDVVEIVTTTGDVHVVEEQSPHFTSASAQMLIQDIMVCSRDLDIIKQKTNDVEQKMKNMIDVLGRI